MIGFIQGEILAFDTTKALVKTNSGIGYEVIYSGVLNVGSTKEFYTSFIVKETSQQLFGFDNLAERNVFELLLGVKGVGPKSAYALIGSLGPDQLFNSILLDNKKVLQSVPGIGAKAAAQIILDLQTKVSKMERPQMNNGSISSTVSTEFASLSIYNDSLLACTELGFKESEIIPLLNKLLSNSSTNNNELSSNDIIKKVLQSMN